MRPAGWVVDTLYGMGAIVAVPIIVGVAMAISISVISFSGRVLYRNMLFGSQASNQYSSIQKSKINRVEKSSMFR